VKSDVFNIGEIPHSDGVIMPEEVCYAIDKLKMNKACGQDRITANTLVKVFQFYLLYAFLG